jgi:hypothetical protein
LRASFADLLFAVVRGLARFAEAVDPPSLLPICADCGLVRVADDEPCPVCDAKSEEQEMLRRAYHDGRADGWQAHECLRDWCG